MKITVLPPGPEPVRYTASCVEMGELLKNSPNGDLTIDERRRLWGSWTTQPLQGKPLMDRVAEMIQEVRK